MTIPTNATAEEIAKELEADGYMWDISVLSAGTYECRLWRWPHVKAKYRASEFPGMAGMLRGAIDVLANGGRNI
jgi:hypothetical protein